MRSASPLAGILLMDKPQGWTSHDVVAKARGITKQRRIGHTGTLDPMATGLLVLCLGQATRLVEYMSGHDKRYEGEIQLGVRTDTDDADGAVIATQAAAALTADGLRRLAERFTGRLMQRPPAYSAVKIAGRRAYSVARAGGAPQLAERPVTVHEMLLERLPMDRLRIVVHCGPGTYVRSLARDIGDELGCGAHLSALRRATVGRFDVHDAVTLAALEAIVAGGRLAEILLPVDDGVSDTAAAILTAGRARLLATGAVLEGASALAKPASLVRIYGSDGTFVGTAAVAENGQIRPLKVLWGQHSP
jgi:tRNA pseudouridine55 synthase